jgi:hypothetical protein
MRHQPGIHKDQLGEFVAFALLPKAECLGRSRVLGIISPSAVSKMTTQP